MNRPYLWCSQSLCLSLNHMEVLPGDPWAERFCLLWLWRVKWRTETRRRRSPQQSWSLSLSLEGELQAKNKSRDITTVMATNNLPSLVIRVHIVHISVTNCNLGSGSYCKLFTCKGVYVLSFALLHSWQRHVPLKTNTFFRLVRDSYRAVVLNLFDLKAPPSSNTIFDLHPQYKVRYFCLFLL